MKLCHSGGKDLVSHLSLPQLFKSQKCPNHCRCWIFDIDILREFKGFFLRRIIETIFIFDEVVRKKDAMNVGIIEICNTKHVVHNASVQGQVKTRKKGVNA